MNTINIIKKLKTMKKSLLLLLFLITLPASSQWTANFSGYGTGDYEIADAKGLATCVDSDGKCYVAGYITQPGTNSDIIVIKYDKTGDTLWSRTFNGSGNSEDKAFGIVTDEEDNIYVTGIATRGGLSRDIVVLKYSSSGILRWANFYSGTNQEFEDKGSAICIDNIGDIYVTGFASGEDGTKDIVILKFSPDGTLVYEIREDGPDNNDSEGYGIVVDSDNMIIVTGYTTDSDGSTDIIILKYAANGNYRWGKVYDGGEELDDKAFGIVVDENDNIYITGYITTEVGDAAGDNTDAILIKYGRNGSLKWTERYNGGGNISTDKAFGIVVDEDNNMIYIAGQTGVSGGSLDYLLVKFTYSGNQKWATTYDGPANGDDYANAIDIMRNNKVVVTGASFGSQNNFDYATVKFNKNGQLNNQYRYSMNGYTDDIAKDVAVSKTNTNNIFVTGYSEMIVDNQGTTSTISTEMILDNDTENEIVTEIPSEFSLSQNYPNPFNPSTNIQFSIPEGMTVKLVIYDILGKVTEVLVNQNLAAGSYTINYKNVNLSSGVYFYELTAGSFRDIKKMTLIK
jgi:uncharacterized delta-60 repeat protein